LVSRKEVYIVIFIAFIILTTMFLIKKSLLKTTYDEDNAQASGINTKIINLIFIILVSMLITLAIPIT
jgi:zinc transport system permease protein